MEEDPKESGIKKDYLLPASILISTLILSGSWIYKTGLNSAQPTTPDELASAEEAFSQGIELPIRWGDLGTQLVKAGVIDKEQFLAVYDERGGLPLAERRLLESAGNGNIKISHENSGVLLNLLWALGLGNKNPILEKGPMSDPKYVSAGRFASTGGWTIAQGDPMDHFSRHPFIVLTPEQQKLVEQVSKNIYRPCCNNSTYFPDCNHGMAMLGLLQLMASQNIGEKEMYKIALQVNTYWFPDTYVNIAKYLAMQGVDWANADPKEILGLTYSSGSGYRNIVSKIPAPAKSSGGGCAVAAPTPAPAAPKPSGGCGI